MDYETWKAEFATIYTARFGITPQEGGMDEDEYQAHFDKGRTPREATQYEMDRYDLTDVTAFQ